MASERLSRAKRGFALLPFAVTSCLLLAEPPILTDACAHQDVGDMVGTNVVVASPDDTRDIYTCPDSPNAPDYVIEWTPTSSGLYEIGIGGSNSALRLGVGKPRCGGELELCSLTGAGEFLYRGLAGETVHIVVEGENLDDTAIQLSIAQVVSQVDPPTASTGSQSSGGPPGGACPYQDDGECDEPHGRGVCPEGSDPIDCDCPYRDDGTCDEPEGLDLCPDYSDPEDCP